jgi:hypothetical protein
VVFDAVGSVKDGIDGATAGVGTVTSAAIATGAGSRTVERRRGDSTIGGGSVGMGGSGGPACVIGT